MNHRKKTKADGSRLIPRKHTETLVLLSIAVHTGRCFEIRAVHNDNGQFPQTVGKILFLFHWETRVFIDAWLLLPDGLMSQSANQLGSESFR